MVDIQTFIVAGVEINSTAQPSGLVSAKFEVVSSPDPTPLRVSRQEARAGLARKKGSRSRR